MKLDQYEPLQKSWILDLKNHLDDGTLPDTTTSWASWFFFESFSTMAKWEGFTKEDRKDLKRWFKTINQEQNTLNFFKN